MSILICGVDVETTGLDTEKDEIIELAAVIWDVERKVPVMMQSELIKIDKPVSPEISAITGIISDDLQDYGRSWGQVADTFLSMATACNYIMAHNGLGFDKPILASNLARLGRELPLRVWIDTMIDVPFTSEMKARKLGHVAAEHGFLNPFPHRALFDVLTMLRVASFYDINALTTSAKSPLVTVQALCRKPWEDGGASTDEAKKNGYRWDGVNKRWIKQLRQAAYAGQASTEAYKTVIIG